MPASAASHFDTVDRAFKVSTTPAIVALRFVTVASLRRPPEVAKILGASVTDP
jgi:hypothetical protein